MEQRVEIGVDDRVPIRGAHVAEGAVASDAGVVHQDVYGADFSANDFEGAARRLPIRHVPLRARDVAPLGCHVPHPSVLALGAGSAARYHPVPILAQAPADGSADAAHAASNIRNPRYLTHHGRPLVRGDLCDFLTPLGEPSLSL